MTDSEIITLVEEYFVEQNPFCGFTSKEYAGGPDTFLKFARAMYEKGKEIGYWEGYGGDELTELERLIADAIYKLFKENLK